MPVAQQDNYSKCGPMSRLRCGTRSSVIHRGFYISFQGMCPTVGPVGPIRSVFVGRCQNLWMSGYSGWKCLWGAVPNENVLDEISRF